jgi:hypothetical protein
MAKTKKTPAAAAKTTSPTKSPSFSGSPRRKSSELKKLEAVSTRGSHRINLLKMIECNEGVQLIFVAIPGKPGVEGFARDLILLVTDGNDVLSGMFITSVGERRSADGADTPRKNHRGCWCRVVIRITDRPESFAEKRAVLDRIDAVSFCFTFVFHSVVVAQLMLFVCLFLAIIIVIEHP